MPPVSARLYLSCARVCTCAVPRRHHPPRRQLHTLPRVLCWILVRHSGRASCSVRRRFLRQAGRSGVHPVRRRILLPRRRRRPSDALRRGVVFVGRRAGQLHHLSGRQRLSQSGRNRDRALPPRDVCHGWPDGVYTVSSRSRLPLHHGPGGDGALPARKLLSGRTLRVRGVRGGILPNQSWSHVQGARLHRVPPWFLQHCHGSGQQRDVHSVPGGHVLPAAG